MIDTRNVKEDLKPAVGIVNGLLFVAAPWSAAVVILLWVWLS